MITEVEEKQIKVTLQKAYSTVYDGITTTEGILDCLWRDYHMLYELSQVPYLEHEYANRQSWTLHDLLCNWHRSKQHKL